MTIVHIQCRQSFGIESECIIMEHFKDCLSKRKYRTLLYSLSACLQLKFSALDCCLIANAMLHVSKRGFYIPQDLLQPRKCFFFDEVFVFSKKLSIVSSTTLDFWVNLSRVPFSNFECRKHSHQRKLSLKGRSRKKSQ